MNNFSIRLTWLPEKKKSDGTKMAPVNANFQNLILKLAINIDHGLSLHSFP